MGCYYCNYHCRGEESWDGQRDQMANSRPHSNIGYRYLAWALFLCHWAVRGKSSCCRKSSAPTYHLMSILVKCLATKPIRLDASFWGSLGWGEEVMNSLRKQIRYYLRKYFQTLCLQPYQFQLCLP